MTRGRGDVLRSLTLGRDDVGGAGMEGFLLLLMVLFLLCEEFEDFVCSVLFDGFQKCSGFEVHFGGDYDGLWPGENGFNPEF